MARGIVCIGEFPNAALAALAQGMLQEEGIQSEVAGAMTQAWGAGEIPFFGVRLEVRAEDAERARALIDQVESATRARVARESEATGSVPAEEPQAVEAADLQPEAGDTSEEPMEAESTAADEPAAVDAQARRARNAALISLAAPILLPVAWVLLFASIGRSAGTSAGRWWWRQAVLLTLIGTALWVWIFANLR